MPSDPGLSELIGQRFLDALRRIDHIPLGVPPEVNDPVVHTIIHLCGRL